jgi:hypothetical protein
MPQPRSLQVGAMPLVDHVQHGPDHSTSAGAAGLLDYGQWLLHHFYDLFPTVEHFTPVA